MDKHKDNGIRLENLDVVKCRKEVIALAANDPELLNTVYREISERLGLETAISIYQMFKGQQVTFPTRFLNPAIIRLKIIQEYDGTNIKTLATMYNYSEKSIRRIIKKSADE